MGSVHLTTPPRYLFKFPPSELPLALPPPWEGVPTLKAPIQIPADIYQRALDPKVPFTFAVCYITVVLSLNALNRSRAWKPWWITRTRIFTPLVAAHNLSLAVYSGITFFAMFNALYRVWPTMDSSTRSVDIVDALCKINGPRGLGDAVAYNATQNVWASNNSMIKLAGSLPDPTDVGRFWNEGLAFWGWLFYLSKFYEVLDTFVILARGKRSPTLQTYHHAGAMLCMWSGIRFMSPPIWMFCFINSFIHTLMYIYFTLATVGAKVPKVIKQTLTTMQIAQFLIGASFAGLHLFVKYDIPVTTSYKVLTPIKSAASAASSVISSLAHENPSSIVSAAASAVTTPALGAVLKRLLLRAAGDEGLAENVRDPASHLIPAVSSAHSSASSAASAATSAAAKFVEETKYRQSIATVDCIDTTGQSFAIWLNIIYLAPLTVLFVRFFVKAYITGTINKKSGKPNRRTSFHDAIVDVKRDMDNAGEEVERRLSEQVAKDVSAMRDGKFELKQKLREKEAEVNGKLSDSRASLASDRAIDDSGDEGDEADEGKSDLDHSVSGTPDKKKKKRNRKRKQHDAAHAGQPGTASFADVAKEGQE